MDSAIGNVYDEPEESSAVGMVPVENIVVGMGPAGKNAEVDMGFAADEVAVVEDAVHNHNHTHGEVEEDTPRKDNNVPQAVERIETESAFDKEGTVVEQLMADEQGEEAEDDTLHREELAGLAR